MVSRLSEKNVPVRIVIHESLIAVINLIKVKQDLFYFSVRVVT